MAPPRPGAWCKRYMNVPEELANLLFREYDGKMLKNGESNLSEKRELVSFYLNFAINNLLLTKILTRKAKEAVMQ